MARSAETVKLAVMPAPQQRPSAASPDDGRGPYTVEFNGRALAVFKRDPSGGPFSPGGFSEIRSWRAVSGRPGYQAKACQSLKDKGPIPEGRYLVRPRNLQKMTEVDDMVGTILSPASQLLFRRKLGAWPGGSIAWGVWRVPLEPLPGTNT